MNAMRNRAKVGLFLSLAVSLLAVLPVYNLWAHTHKRFPEQKLWSGAVLFNFDGLSGWLGRKLYPYGISLDAKQAIIGAPGWMYLGDQYAETLSATRRGLTEQDRVLAEQTRAQLAHWKHWFEAQPGVRAFRIMLGPNTASIYPEHLPHWAQPPAGPNRTDVLLRETAQTGYVDSRIWIRQAKTRWPEPVYFPLDSHWNNVGAWQAYRALAASLHEQGPGAVQWLAPAQVDLSAHHDKMWDDLLAFVRVPSQDRMDAPNLTVLQPRIDLITQTDYLSGKVLRQSPNQLLPIPERPLLVTSSHALNPHKVLWLRDSFGGLQAPAMAATFQQTLQWYWPAALADVGTTQRLIQQFKPDYVIMTVVERDALAPVFRAPPAPTPSAR